MTLRARVHHPVHFIEATLLQGEGVITPPQLAGVCTLPGAGGRSEGFTVNMVKSCLVPTQQIAYLELIDP